MDNTELPGKSMSHAQTYLLLLIFFFCAGLGVAGGGQESPAQVVNEFCARYGGPDMDTIAGRTTARFRDNRPESVWVLETWRTLHQLAYERLDETVSGVKTDGDKAAVVLTATIGTQAGRSTHKEIYYLIKKSEAWLIDELEIIDEDVRPSTEGQPL